MKTPSTLPATAIIITNIAAAISAFAQPVTIPEQAKIDKLEGQQLCIQIGRTIRSDARMEYRDAMVARAINNGWMSKSDLGYITTRRVRIGMSLCSTLAALGAPNSANKSTARSGITYSFHYNNPRMFITLSDDKIDYISE